jgi:hypothetical protein
MASVRSGHEVLVCDEMGAIRRRLISDRTPKPAPRLAVEKQKERALPHG